MSYAKLWENIVRDAVMNHMKINNLFSNKQFGFLSGRSTTLQLHNVLDDWTEALDNGHIIDIIYIYRFPKSLLLGTT